MNDRMWTATVIRLLALIKGLLYVTSIVTSGTASRELRASEIDRRRYADFRAADLASAADDQHGVFGQDGFNSETRHRGFVGGKDVAFAGQAMADGSAVPKSLHSA